MQRDRVYNVVRKFVAEELLEGEDIGLDEETPLLDYGLIDSVSLVMLNDHVEEQLGVRIPNPQLTPQNLETLDAITETILSLE